MNEKRYWNIDKRSRRAAIFLEVLQMIPLEKQSKKKKREYYAEKRGCWHGVSPITRIVPDRRRYDRNRLKREARRAFED